MGDDEVAKELYKVQKDNKCLILLDDIWTVDAWKLLEAAFPVQEETESRIILTTRRREVGLSTDKDCLLHEPRLLNKNESWELFEKKSSFRKQGTNLKYNEEMKKLGEEMLKHCDGLPLAIIVLSGLLSTKCTIEEWEKLSENVKEYIYRGKLVHAEEYQSVSSILSLSYDELPYHLKPCFLHLAHSPEDHELKVSLLCHTWIAEGFISLDHKTQSSTDDDVAYNYLTELLDRNMIQVGRLGPTGRIKSCHIHDLMRDMSLFKAREENFLQFFDLRSRDRVVPRNKVRRLAIYTDRAFDDLLPFINGRDDTLRSLIYFQSCGSKPSEKVLKLFLNHFKFLRVLRLEAFGLYAFDRSWKLPKEIGKLIHLRLVSIRGSRVHKIPSSIGNLRCLETLDLRSENVEIPNVIWRLEQLRHLYLPTYGTYNHHSKDRLRLRNVKNSLQTLCNVSTERVNVNDFLQLTNLKKLVLAVGKDLGKIYHNYTGVKFTCVRSLSLLEDFDFAGTEDIIPVISCYPEIYELKVHMAIIRLPEEHQFSHKLERLSLRGTYLEDDPMRTIEKLPNLRALQFGEKSFRGEKMVCSKGGFPLLESLCFDFLYLEEWRIEDEALTSLCYLRIRNCFALRKLPDGLRNVTTLKEVKIEGYCYPEFTKRLEKGGEDFYKVQHVPSISENLWYG